MSDDWIDNEFKCFCGLVTERIVRPINDGEVIEWICPEHGEVGEFIRLNEGELDLGITEQRQPKSLLVAAVIAVLLVALFCAILAWYGTRDNGADEQSLDSHETTVASTVWSGPLNLPPPITDAATTTRPATRAEVQIQVTEPVPPPVPVMPTPIPGDCGSWQAVFRWYGATDEEIYFFFVSTPWGRKNVIYHESLCGVRFRNPDTSDTGICQLNGIHRDWVAAEFGLRLGSRVSEAEASNPYYAAACLYLLRGLNHTPNTFGTACAWHPPNFCA